jgi:hypothetical protein
LLFLLSAECGVRIPQALPTPRLAVEADPHELRTDACSHEVRRDGLGAALAVQADYEAARLANPTATAAPIQRAVATAIDRRLAALRAGESQAVVRASAGVCVCVCVRVSAGSVHARPTRTEG